ncbi:TPA: hypothetical protein ACJIWA_002485 [Enterobacter bugandensis]|uniref:hypothetical protein n=1 Tax=Enterobacter TaxID=547 RepID=UPI0006432019|nr:MULTISPECIES: hypothetical protein [Enterobacter]EHN8828162.1 hypothetical protein [Enterobacter bugandensis]EHN8845910.1 hypothetical protein [Enterobacter bugandensis]KLQ30753.1 hypothetical protein ABR33_11985 [Enterobacter bugandensis]MBE3489757.1 hypothetical protein [Enterobacter cloacae complex sp. P12RS]MBE4806595.1 hypothetical protein [Enterobacter cloacae complex sp. P43RS]
MIENITPDDFDPRSEAIISYAVMLIALGRKFSMTPADLSRWVLEEAMARGYDLFLFNGHAPTLSEYARHFSEGRRLLYSEVKMVEDSQSISVISRLYMTDKKHIPDAFYLYDVDIDVYYRYVSDLASHHAAIFGIHMAIEHRDGKEIATFFKG